MPPDSPVDLTVGLKDLLPKAVIDDLLPNEDTSILSLFQQFNQYPPHPTHYVLPSDIQLVLYQDAVEGFDHKSLLQIPPPALPSVSKAYQDAIKKSEHPILSVALQPQYGDPIVLPAWVFNYWVEIGHVVDIRKWWKVALGWVKEHATSPLATEHCQNILLGLSSFSWSHGAAYTCDIISLLSDSSVELYLNSFQIDHMIEQTKAQHEAQYGPDATSHHIFATVDMFNAIV